MTGANSSEILSGAVAEVLETMFFTSVLGEAEAGQPPPARLLCARARFRGRPPGVFEVQVPAETARVLAAGFLGIDDEISLSAALIEEVVRELTNMLCGAVLSKIESESSFEILDPELLPEPGRPAGSAIVRRLALDNGTIMVALTPDKLP